MNEDTRNNLLAATTGGGLLGLNKLLLRDSVRNYLEQKARESEFDARLSKPLGNHLEEYNNLFKVMLPSNKPLPLTLSSNRGSGLQVVTDLDHNIILDHPVNNINIRVKTNRWDPVGFQGLNKPVNMAVLAHEIGHYKNYLKDKKSLLLKADDLARTRIPRINNIAGLGIGGGLYAGSKALGASDESALTAGAVGGGLYGIARDLPALTSEGLASINGIKGLIKYNKTAGNKIPIKYAISNLAKAYATYLRRPLANSAKMAGLGLTAGGLINFYKNILKKND